MNLDYFAPAWKVALAKAFGERAVIKDDGFMLTVYCWRGRIYVTDFHAGRSPSTVEGNGQS